MEISVWWEEQLRTREGWRCALITSGEQCVIAPGTAMMQLLCASSLGTLQQEVSAHQSVGVLLLKRDMFDDDNNKAESIMLNHQYGLIVFFPKS